MDWDEFVPQVDLDADRIIVPPTENPLTREQYTLLCESFDSPSMSDTCNGVDMYCAVRQYISEIISP